MALLDQMRMRIAAWKASRTSGGEIAPVGLYHFLRASQGEKTRAHLRIDPDGRGLLMVNASRVYHLNPSAASMAYLALHENTVSNALAHLGLMYSAPVTQLKQDYEEFCDQLDTLLHPDEACPVCDLDLETTLPFSARPSAPYRMDLALTYRCNNNCGHCYNARPRNYPELNTDAWKQILDRLWDLRIPHIVFTGGEPTLRPDLPELIRHAEINGQITGINTNGRKLSEPAYVEELVTAGLDHVQITLESHDVQVHTRMTGSSQAWEQTIQGLRNVLASSLYVMTNTTLLTHNYENFGQTLDFLAELGVPTIGLNALIYSGRGIDAGTGLAEKDLEPLLDLARRQTQKTGQRLIWYTPTQYCHFDPIQMELGVKGCTAALYNMCVEPDGGVIPCQSYYQPVGNILDNDWESIWNADVCLDLRERRGLPERCQACQFLGECGGGCPLARQANQPTSAALSSVRDQ